MTITVGLAWHSLRPGNLGVDALSRTDIAIIDAAARTAGVDVQYVLMGNPAEDNGPPDMERVTQGPRPSVKELLTLKSSYFAAVGKCDLVVDIGEGDSFTDIYGMKRFVVQVLSKLGAIMKGKPLIMAPQTIGPFSNPICRAIGIGLMKRCDRVYSRDKLSSQALIDLGVTKNTQEAIDLAFRLPYETRPKAPEGVTRIGLNVSGLLMGGGYTSSNQFGLSLDYPAFTRALIEHFLAMDKVEVWLVPHVLAPGSIEDDVAASVALQKEYPSLQLAPTFRDSSDAKSFIATLDYLVAARMHACIGAFSAGVPVAPVAYSRKFRGLFGTLGYPHVVEAQSISTEQAIAQVKEGFEKRDVLAEDIRKGLTIVHDRLQAYEDYVSSVLRRVAAGKTR